MDKQQKLTIIIPCYNEEKGIPNLAKQLNPVLETLKKQYSIEVLFIDDGSTDNTYELLHHYFKDLNHTEIIKHGKNRNLGGALKTGFYHASGDLVATLDSDCTYNPALLIELLDLLDKHTDIVTVSPYHPKGKVNNVPKYRVFLSKAVSQFYRTLLSSKLHTYTAMVRVYRKDVVRNVQFKSNTFLGVTEIMIRSILKDYSVKELPAELNVRKFGKSKMKTLSVMLDHVNLLSKIVLYRFLGKEI